MRYKTLNEWLTWQEGLHPSRIDLGLERVNKVLRAMGRGDPPFAVVTVGGTNGKGSSVTMLATMLAQAGYRVGLYTSPHLLRYNERIRIAGAEATDAALCAAFERIDQARGDTSLTYFEFATLAALDLFWNAGVDAAVLEVGLGGRLDAVNVLNPDVALVTTVDIDHTAWLGPDRETIGREKAGIFRARRPAVCTDEHPPHSLVNYARDLEAPLYLIGRDFGVEETSTDWTWWGPRLRRADLPFPRLPGAHQLRNAAGVLMVLALLSGRFALTQDHIRAGLAAATVPGRFQILDDRGLRICDVAHNPHGARAVAATLAARPCAGATHAVFAMRADKDIAGVVEAMAAVVDVWHVAGLQVERGAQAADIAPLVRARSNGAVHAYDNVVSALKGAAQIARPDDRIIVFGSFHTVSQALDTRYRDLWHSKPATVVSN